MNKKMKIDKLDLEIIKHLQEDARVSFRYLGKKLKVPHTTIFTRAEKLIKKGIIKKFSAIIHPHDVGLQMGFIIINAPPARSKEIAERIASFNEARKVFRTFDGKIIAKVVVPREHQGLEEFLSKLRLDNDMTVYAVHDIVKFEDSIHPDLIKDTEFYKEK